MATWSAPVRFGEADPQGIVFNANYLLYCDEAMAAFCVQRGIAEFFELVRVVRSTLTWSGPARPGDVLDVDVRCAKVGRTSTTLEFAVRADGRPCCVVETVYVYVDAAGTPCPLPDELRSALLDGEVSGPASPRD